MKKMILFLFVAYSVCHAVYLNPSATPYNCRVIFDDSAAVAKTATVVMQPFSIDNGVEKTALFELRDDITGMSADSCNIRVRIYQVFDISKGGVPYFVRLNSRANPDSTVGEGGSEYLLFDSLDINTLDTGAVYSRNHISITKGTLGLFVRWATGDSLKTKQTSGFGAFAYARLVPDLSPHLAFELTGLTHNGNSTMVKVRVYQAMGVPTRGN